VGAIAVSLIGTLVGAVKAQPQPGDLFIVQSGPGEVTNIKNGGDMSGQAAYASGMSTPQGLCRGPNDELYVTEQGGPPGKVLIITDGGSGAGGGGHTVFATVPGYPTSLWCTDSSVLLATLTDGTFLGEVYDITAGGDLTSANPIATGFRAQLWTIMIAGGSRYGATAYLGTVFDFTAGGDISSQNFAHSILGGSTKGLAEYAGSLYVGADAGERVINFTAGGDMSSAVPYAYGMGPLRGLFADDDLGKMYAANQNMVYEITPGTGGAGGGGGATGWDLSGEVPFATNLGNMFNTQMIYWHGCGDGVIWTVGGEQCDDSNTTDGDGCSSTCQNEGGGGAGGGGVGGAGTGGSVLTGGTGPGGGSVGGSGPGGGSVGGAATGGNAYTGGNAVMPTTTGDDDDSGCDCRLVRVNRSVPTWPALAISLLALVALTRRRR